VSNATPPLLSDADLDRLSGSRRIVAAVGRVWVVSQGEMLSPSRDAHFVEARWVAMHLMRSRLGIAARNVARLMGRDHSTVLHALRSIAARLARDDELRRQVGRVTSALEEMGA
jgi:chromosomal replication initiation ATPase DnaA